MGNTTPFSIHHQTIEIHALEVFCHIGVPEEERAMKQRLLLDIEIIPQCLFYEIGDELEKTVDYAKVAEELVALAEERPRKLIETLADECARWILEHHLAKRVQVRVRKFILPNAEWVAVGTEISR